MVGLNYSLPTTPVVSFAYECNTCSQHSFPSIEYVISSTSYEAMKLMA